MHKLEGGQFQRRHENHSLTTATACSLVFWGTREAEEISSVGKNESPSKSRAEDECASPKGMAVGRRESRVLF